jgi:hypothetical protein
MIFHNDKRVPVSVFRVKIAASGHLKRVTERIFRISMYSYFIEESKKFIIKYFNSKLLQNF